MVIWRSRHRSSRPTPTLTSRSRTRRRERLGAARRRGGSFGASTNFAVGTAPSAVAVGDFNADSDPDLAVANFRHATTSRCCSAAPAAASPRRPTSPPATTTRRRGRRLQRRLRPRPRGRQLGTFSDNVSVLRGARRWQLRRRRRSSPRGTVPSRLAVGDFNADSDPDLAVANVRSRRQRLGPARRRGGASAPRRPSSPVTIQSSRDRRLQRRLDPDLAIANIQSGDVSVLLGGTGGGFGAPTTFARRPGPMRSRVSATSTPTRSRPRGREPQRRHVSVLLNTSRPAVALPGEPRLRLAGAGSTAREGSRGRQPGDSRSASTTCGSWRSRSTSRSLATI